jgi:hypothetical protein
MRYQPAPAGIVVICQLRTGTPAPTAIAESDVPAPQLRLPVGAAPPPVS